MASGLKRCFSSNFCEGGGISGNNSIGGRGGLWVVIGVKRTRSAGPNNISTVLSTSGTRAASLG